MLTISTTVLISVLSGTLVFVISQWFLEIILKPKILMNEKRAKISELMLRYHSEYQNGILTPEQIELIRNANSELLSSAWKCCFRQKKKSKYLILAKEINCIISNQGSKPNGIEIQNAIKTIENIDKNVKITFQYFNDKKKK